MPVVAAAEPDAYPGRVLPALRRRRPPRGRLRVRPRLVGELLLGLLAGVVGGWVAGLVRVRP